MRLRWKLNPRPTGLMAIAASPRGSILHDGEKKYASVSPSDRSGSSWYWVAGWDSTVPHRNTCDEPVQSVDEAKSQAMAYVRSHLEGSAHG